MREIEAKEIHIDNEPYILETEIKDLLIIKRPFYKDDRGGFQEQFRLPDIIRRLGINFSIQQAQQSSSAVGVIRGIHLEPQHKIITPRTGRMMGVYADLRPESNTYLQYLMIEFDNTTPDEALTSVFVPKGIGNSLCVFQRPGDEGLGVVSYQYSVSEIYDPATAGIGIKYNDPTLAIPWPVADPILSDRDKNLPNLVDFLDTYRAER